MALRLGLGSRAGTAEQAIIDIGSNTVRLVIYGGPARAPAVLYNEKVTARLGKGVAEDGKLSEKAMGTVLAALGRFEALLRLRGVKKVQTVATAAARDASNGPAFLARVAALGLNPRLLSGEEEAVTSARGVLAAFPGAVGVVADLGGGSLELTDIDGQRCTHGTSLPLGTLRLPAMRAGGPSKFAGRVKKMLGEADWSTAHGQPLYLVGGSLRALARLAMMRMDWPVDDPHGFEMDPAEALIIARSLAADKRASDKVAAQRLPDARHSGGKLVAAKSAGAKPAVAKLASARPASARLALAPRSLADLDGMRISSSRLASLPDAAALLVVLVRELKPSRLIFSSWGLREGLMADTFTPQVRAANPMVSGIASFVETQSPGLAANAEMVLQWTALARGAPASDMSARGESLRYAATMLALASVAVEPNLRVETAAKWALRKRWIGISAQERAMLAMAVLANASRTTMPAELLRLAPAERLREATAWGLATRLCRRFTGAGPQAITQSSLTVERNTGTGAALVLAVRANMAALYNEVVEKDLRLLAECLCVPFAFRSVSDFTSLP